MPSTDLRLATRTGAELPARLELPLDRAPVATALFLHALPNGDGAPAVAEIVAALGRAGVAVAVPRTDTPRLWGVPEVEDAAAALREQGHPVRLLVGHSLGGVAALLAAAGMPDVRAVAALATPVERARLQPLERGEHGEAVRLDLAGFGVEVPAGLLSGMAGAAVTEAARGLRRPLLVMHSPVDNVIGVDHARPLFEAAKHPKSFVSLHQADHLLGRAEDARFAGEMLAAWAAGYLGREEAPAWQADVHDNRTVVRTAGGLRTEAMTNGFALVLDEPERAGGSNTGPNPYDLLATSLGACTSMTLRLYADRKGWPLEAVMVRVRHRKVHAEDCEGCEEKPRRLDHFERLIHVEGPLDEAQRERLLEIANRCPVHRTLTSEVRVATRLVEDTADLTA